MDNNMIDTIVINNQEYSVNDSELRDLVHQIMKTVVNNNNTLLSYINDLNNRLSVIEEKLGITNESQE